MKRIFSSVLFLITFFLPGTAQPVFSLGPELGFSVSRIPGIDTEKASIDRLTQKSINIDYPFISPVIGLQGCLALKNLYFSAGVVYNITGTVHYLHAVGSGSSIYNNYTWEKKRFHKLSVPFIAGYKVRIRKSHYSFFAGIRPNLLLSGKYFYKWTTTSGTYPAGFVDITKYNPLDPEQAEITADRITNQYVFGLVKHIGSDLKVSLSLNLGEKIIFNKTAATNPYYVNYYKELRNNDFGISLSYKFKSVIKRKKDRISDSG